LEVKDSGGQTVVIEMSLQYKLIKDKVGQLYEDYQKTYETKYMNFIDAELRTIVGNFNQTMFWN